MSEQKVLQERLEIAREILTLLEKKGAGYTVLEMPPSLQIELNSKREEVASLETRLAKLTGSKKNTINNLPRKPSIYCRSRGRNSSLFRCS